jgi:hypothetical protein
MLYGDNIAESRMFLKLNKKALGGHIVAGPFWGWVALPQEVFFSGLSLFFFIEKKFTKNHS